MECHPCNWGLVWSGHTVHSSDARASAIGDAHLVLDLGPGAGVNQS